MAEYESKISLSIGVAGEEILARLEKRLEELEKGHDINIDIVGLTSALGEISKLGKELNNISIENVFDMKAANNGLKTFKNQLDSIKKKFNTIFSGLPDSSKSYFDGVINDFDSSLERLQSEINDFESSLLKYPDKINSRIQKSLEVGFSGEKINKKSLSQQTSLLRGFLINANTMDPDHEYISEDVINRLQQAINLFENFRVLLKSESFNESLFKSLSSDLENFGVNVSEVEKKVKALYNITGTKVPGTKETKEAETSKTPKTKKEESDPSLKISNQLLTERAKLLNLLKSVQSSIPPLNDSTDIKQLTNYNKKITETVKKIQDLDSKLKDFSSAGIISDDFLKNTENLSDIQIESQQALMKKLLSQFPDDKINNLLNFDGKIDGYEQKVNEFVNTLNRLRSIQESGFLLDTGELDGFVNDINKLSASYKELSSASMDTYDNMGRKLLGTVSIDSKNIRAEVESLIKTLGDVDDATLRWAASQKSLTYSMQDSSGVIKQYRASLERVGDEIQVRAVDLGQESFMTKAGRAVASGVQTGSRAIGNFIGLYADINDLIQYARNGINIFKEYNAALTDISYTTEGTKEQIDALGDSYIQLAKDMSSSIADSMKVASIYANLQTSTEEVMQSVEPTLLLSNATGVDASTASDQIQGVLEQFDLGTDQAEHIVDVYESISSNLKLDFSKAIDAVSEGVSVAGQIAADAGMSFEQLSAVIGKVAETTRDSGSEIGNSIKTMLTRISKASTMSDEVDNETISAAAAALDEIGVKVYEADGSFRNLTTILSELRARWDDLTDSQQAYISYQIAATRQTNRFQVLMNSFLDSMQMADEATNNSSGYARELQEKYEESFNGRLQKLKTTAEGFWINFLDNDATTQFIDILTNIVELFTQLTDVITPLGTALGAIFATQGLKKFFSGDFKIGERISNVVG